MVNQARLRAVHPILPVRSVHEALRYYTERLGFHGKFQDHPNEPRYAGIVRDEVCLHMQWHDPIAFREHVDTLSLRILIDDVEALFDEYRTKEVFHAQTMIRDTTWGTREFAFYDLDGNGLTFYRNL